MSNNYYFYDHDTDNGEIDEWKIIGSTYALGKARGGGLGFNYVIPRDSVLRNKEHTSVINEDDTVMSLENFLNMVDTECRSWQESL